ncbi:MAG: glutaredoxin 3 [Rhodospirillales bacterium]|nr:glutaredoxin 3 [Rhodospirillales bacterium]
MPKVEIYSSLFCPYCTRAKRLLDQKGVDYIDVDVVADTTKRSEMMRRAGGRTSVPQIFIDGAHIGGSDELYALERQGRLDALLRGA